MAHGLENNPYVKAISATTSLCAMMHILHSASTVYGHEYCHHVKQGVCFREVVFYADNPSMYQQTEKQKMCIVTISHIITVQNIIHYI